MRTVVSGAALMLAMVASGCSEKDSMQVGAPMAGGARAVALLHTADGADAGRATATAVQGGLRITVDGKALPAGMHGAHIHTIGRCDGPDFMTAAGHWNPTGAKHGSMNALGPHEGDLPNLVIASDGRGAIGAVIPGATIAGLLDADGSALVVHAGADDLMTDPSGNSGARIACGVFTAG